MALVTPRNFRTSLRFALRGIAYVYRHERNFRIHIVFAIAAIALAFALNAGAMQWLFIVTAIVSVLALEIVNTIFEKLIDMLQPRVHHYAEVVKNLMAAAVLVASVSSLIVGAVIFIPLIITRLT